MQDRLLELERIGDPAAATRILVVGSIHGNETAGHAVVRRLRRLAPPAGVQLWLVETANPDGVRAGTRQNARGVDLNRNFPFRWAGGGRPFATYFPGPAPASEPETHALRGLIARVEPDLSVHYHQHMRLVVPPRGGGPRPRPRVCAPRGPARALPPGTTAFVVELPAARPSRATADRHARAVLAAPAPARAVGGGLAAGSDKSGH